MLRSTPHVSRAPGPASHCACPASRYTSTPHSAWQRPAALPRHLAASAQGRSKPVSTPGGGSLAGAPRRAQRCGAVRTAAGAAEDVFVLDLDGVVIDSEPELSSTGFKAASELWPEAFEGLSAARRGEVMRGMRLVRPRLISGFETMPMARLLVEDSEGAVGRILESWGVLLPELLQRWGTEEGVVRQAWKTCRDRRMAEDRAAWLAENKLYQGIRSSLHYTQSPFYFATSKSAVQTAEVLRGLLDLDLPPDSPRLFTSLIPPNERKIEALRAVSERPLVAELGAKLHFVDDRFETVAAVAADPALRALPKFQAYFATWGYNTEAEREAALQLDGVRSITLEQFNELLTFGILMGVNDGCEEVGIA